MLKQRLIDEFVKITNDSKNDSSIDYVYGTIKMIDNSPYITIDGSSEDTPISLTSSVKDGDRVQAIIKNHTVIEIGNISNPSASEEYVEERINPDYGTVEFDYLYASGKEYIKFVEVTPIDWSKPLSITMHISISTTNRLCNGEYDLTIICAPSVTTTGGRTVNTYSYIGYHSHAHFYSTSCRPLYQIDIRGLSESGVLHASPIVIGIQTSGNDYQYATLSRHAKVTITDLQNALSEIYQNPIGTASSGFIGTDATTSDYLSISGCTGPAIVGDMHTGDQDTRAYYVYYNNNTLIHAPCYRNRLMARTIDGAWRAIEMGTSTSATKTAVPQTADDFEYDDITNICYYNTSTAITTDAANSAITITHITDLRYTFTATSSGIKDHAGVYLKPWDIVYLKIRISNQNENLYTTSDSKGYMTSNEIPYGFESEPSPKKKWSLYDTQIMNNNLYTSLPDTYEDGVGYIRLGYMYSTIQMRLEVVNQVFHKYSDSEYAMSTKVDKEIGKGLSTNDFTDAEKNKLSSIEYEANKTIVDVNLSSESTNPVQNKTISDAIFDINSRINAIPTYTIMIGASSSTDGSSGLVPKPIKGQQSYFLRGDGIWSNISKSTIGLGNVDNTSDINKPISTAVQTALNNKISVVPGWEDFIPALADDGTLNPNGGMRKNEIFRAGEFDTTDLRVCRYNGIIIIPPNNTISGYPDISVRTNGGYCIQMKYEQYNMSGQIATIYYGKIFIENTTGRMWLLNNPSDSENPTSTWMEIMNPTILSQINNKVDKESGKGLSTNDYTTAEKLKLAGISPGSSPYILPPASSTVLGGVMLGDNVVLGSDGRIKFVLM